MTWAAELGSSILLFFLVFGMSATVELKQLVKQLRNRTALLIGLALQFLILPFCGFVVVNLLRLPPPMGITLLVITSSPGGSYSNWWCSMFNASLALSVTMTAISTLLSTVMLPANLVLYTKWSYSSDVIDALDWSALFISLVVVIGGISCGLISSEICKRRGHFFAMKFHRRANLMGNFAGVSLVCLSVAVSSSGPETSLWSQGPEFYIGVALPAVIGLGIATYMGTKFELEKPERVSVSVEACYQNTGIATSVALTMFAGHDDDLSTAIGVPLYYGIVEAVMLAFFCLVCWKIGWTKAPTSDNICKVLINSYEVDEVDVQEQEEAVEVVYALGEPKDMIYHSTHEGTYVFDGGSLEGLQKHSRFPSGLNAEAANNYDEGTARCSDESTDEEVPSHISSSPGKLGIQKVPSQDDDLPSSSTQEGGDEESKTTRIIKEQVSRTIAVFKARSEGYRRPPPKPKRRDRDTRVFDDDDDANETNFTNVQLHGDGAGSIADKTID